MEDLLERGRYGHSKYGMKAITTTRVGFGSIAQIVRVPMEVDMHSGRMLFGG